ncbi:hypothetical protein ACFPIK_16195 [Algoriphagus aquatilis]|uniref:Uncharacterized protein n=1 Tax=Algoriphagus aquatilis TaxID=490186 RepID=A0ABW0BZB6_9BACT
MPIGLKVPGIGGGLPKGIPANGLEALATKPEIPYLEELRQVQGLKNSYDSLRSEVKKLKEAAQDSTTQDSVVSVLKAKGQEVLDREAEVLQSMLEEQEIPGEELKSAVDRTLEGVESSKTKLAQVSDLEGLDGLLDQSEENLKALINEWLMPKIEQTLSGTLSECWNPANAKIPDFYGKDALDQLMQQGAEPKELMAQAKETAVGKAKHIPDEYLEKLNGKSAKLLLDTLGNVQVELLKDPKRKLHLLEPNELKDAKLLERTGILLWYDPLTSFGEGIFAEAGLSYGFTQQVEAYGTWVAKRFFDEGEGPVREGDGIRLGLRFTKSTWSIQTSVAKMRMDIRYPNGYEQNNFSGSQWSGEVALVKPIPMGESIRSVVILSWDPPLGVEEV